MDEKHNATTCSNCKYYQRYYVIGFTHTFTPTSLWRCINADIAKSLSNKHVRKDEGCELWQSFELQKLSIQYCAELRLQRISKDIADVLTVLRDIK